MIEDMKKNIVLIGMPSCGKTTIAKQLSKKLSIPCYDSDVLIEEREKRTIAEIFKTDGESYFRQIEQDVISIVSQHTESIISTGGGVILQEENINRLKENGILFFIKRDLTLLNVKDASRPLSKDYKALEEMYAKRLPLYKKYADAIVLNNGKIEEVVQAIIKITGGTMDDYHNNKNSSAQ